MVSAEVVRMEGHLRAQFVYDRAPRPPSPEERKDLTDFAHSANARIVKCRFCGALKREDSHEPVRTYADDSYDQSVMDRLFPRYVEAFAAKADPYRTLLPERAEVVEVGPHVGGFLQTAADWGWNAVGVDVGKDTANFVNARGLTTHNSTLEACRFPSSQFDGVFIWNCFEQLPEPDAMLQESRRIVKRGGMLVLRVPNALFYSVSRGYLEATPNPEITTWVTRALGYSNLLGWPYLYGYTDRHLDRMAERNCFTRAAGLNSELIILPLPELSESVIEEKRAALATLQGWSEFEKLDASGRLTGPWIELIYRAV